MPDALNALVTKPSSYNDFPVVGPKTVDALQAYIDHTAPPEATEGHIEALLGSIAGMPKKGRSEGEARLEVERYIVGLKEFSLPDLKYAFRQASNECTFFPQVAEIRAYAIKARSARAFKIMQAKVIILKHRKEWAPPKEITPIPPEEIAAIIAETAAELGNKSNLTKRIDMEQNEAEKMLLEGTNTGD